MQNVIELKNRKIFKEIYGDNADYNWQRFNELANRFKSIFSSSPTHYLSTPGRVEISGNHTDHNHGKVIAGSINLDSIAVAAPTGGDLITIYSEGYNDPFMVKLSDLIPQDAEEGKTSALIRGVASGLSKEKYIIGGFNAYISSDVLVGSGLSSSASIEILIGTILNELYNDSQIPFEKLALIGQYAENHYFGKPCGLMDQVACAAGGIVAIDFKSPNQPMIEKLSVDFGSSGYSLIIVDTGGNHADLTADYASIPAEMKQVAAMLGKTFLRECCEEEFHVSIPKIREKLGDRAVLRAIHFFEENKRVDKQIELLKTENFDGFLNLVNESGNSSFKFLQNIFTIQDVREQGVSLALAVSSIFIDKIGRGACRINGGGFAGTIEAFIPNESVQDYSSLMAGIFSTESVKVLTIRNIGTVCLSR